MQATPSTWRMLIDSGWAGAAQLKALCGGEALPQELADKRIVRNALVHCGTCTVRRRRRSGRVRTDLSHRATRSTSVVPSPTRNCMSWIAMPRSVRWAYRASCISAARGVTRGYLNRAELTAERFVADPYSSVEGARLYRTGDLVRYRDNGMLEYLGRLDHQVKVRGYRIELGEIESVLGSHEAVNTAVVVAHEMGAGDTRLVAYIVPESRMRWTPLNCAITCVHSLPDYMIPQHLMETGSVTVTAQRQS